MKAGWLSARGQALLVGPVISWAGEPATEYVCVAALAATFAALAAASSLWQVLLLMVPYCLSGMLYSNASTSRLTKHAVLAARTMVTQLSSEEDRARVLGYVAVSYSVGFLVGPAVGGLLTAVSLQFAAWVATAGSAVSLAMVLLMLPGDPPGSRHSSQGGKAAAPSGGSADASGTGTPEDAGGGGGDGSKEGKEGRVARQSTAGWLRDILWPFVEVARRPGVAHLLAGKVLVGLGSAVYQSLFPVLLQRAYGLDPRQNGMVMSYVGALLLAGDAGAC
ncbi:hypothetical protein TSOC_001886 [Tetrabaena socialis]|uniref:Major facilitator superfamily (MFS) profile domain-containing protein n=1 Tax=Tetrabaena socialis TaxID=47790 RepID=A0A2J8AFG3_9CHLO|nr:hypothetical protein TSOC_001886 [Tetrabaena socialis]|eukprot:PNH11263.1 hypothetical protein TSOC_001886 [Tetrabaena socialis]